MNLLPPWPSGYSINAGSRFGPRVHPITGVRKMHHGVDVALPVGTPLTAPADGLVAHKGSGASGGYTLIVEHAPDLFTVYYHLQKPSHLSKGQSVRQGEVIAYSGNTGASTGPHLHFETRRSRRWGDTFNPESILLPHASEKPQEPVSEPKPEPATVTAPEPVKPSESVVEPPRVKPMSAGLKRFFDIQRALKGIRRK